MSFTTRPRSGPARRAWSIFSLVLGEVLELRFVQEHGGNPNGFWRVRFYDRETRTEDIEYVPVRNIAAIPDELLRRLQAIRKSASKLEQRLKAAERRVIKLKLAGAPEEPGPLTADVVFEQRGIKIVPRLRIRKRRPGEGSPPVQ